MRVAFGLVATALIRAMAQREDGTAPCDKDCRCDLKRIDATTLSAKELMIKLSEVDEPVVIDNLIKDWPDFKRWNLEQFEKNHGIEKAAVPRSDYEAKEFDLKIGDITSDMRDNERRQILICTASKPIACTR